MRTPSAIDRIADDYTHAYAALRPLVINLRDAAVDGGGDQLVGYGEGDVVDVAELRQLRITDDRALTDDQATQFNRGIAARALRQPVRGHVGRAFAEGGDLVHVALFQAHAMPVFQVDGGNDQHGEMWMN